MLLSKLNLEKKIKFEKENKTVSHLTKKSKVNAFTLRNKKGFNAKRREPKIIKNLKVCKTYMYLASKNKNVKQTRQK